MFHSSRPYYLNRATGQTTWTPPAVESSAKPHSREPAPASTEWEPLSDPASGKTYYRNRSTGQTSWTVPASEAPQLPAIENAPLPVDWEQLTDPASGKPYYRNRTTGTTSWTLPPADAAAPSSREPPSESCPCQQESPGPELVGRPHKGIIGRIASGHF